MGQKNYRFWQDSPTGWGKLNTKAKIPVIRIKSCTIIHEKYNWHFSAASYFYGPVSDANS